MPAVPRGRVGLRGPSGASAFTFKGTKATVGDLPSSGNVNGDIWVVLADSSARAWTGTAWVDAGSLQGPPGADGTDGASAWADITGKPAVIAAGASQAAARAAISAPATTDLDAKVNSADLDSLTDTHLTSFLPANDYLPIVVLDVGDATTGIADGTIIFRRTVATGGTITINERVSSGSTTDGTTFSTASYTPTTGALHLAIIATGLSTGTPLLGSGALTGAGGLTWSKIADATTAHMHLGLYVGTGTPSAAGGTITPGASVGACVWKFLDITNVNTTVVQSAGATPASSSTTPGVTMSGVSGANLVLGFIVQNGSNVINPGSGFSAIGATEGQNTPSLYLAAESKTVGQNTVGFVTTGTIERCVIAAEVAPA